MMLTYATLILNKYSHGFSNFNDIVIQKFLNVGNDCGNTSLCILFFDYFDMATISS
jgi:hypothetical protein